MPNVLVGGVGIRCGCLVIGNAARVEKRCQHIVGLERAEVGGDLGALGRDGAPVIHRDAGEAGAAEFQVQVGGVAVLVGDVQKDVLAAHGLRLDSFELVADGRCDLEPRRARAHDRIDLRGAEPPGRRVVGARGTGVRVRAGQDFSRSRQPVLGDDLVADAMPAHIVEPFDAEVGEELSCVPPAASLMVGAGTAWSITTASLSGSWIRLGCIHMVANCRSISTVMSTSTTTVSPGDTESNPALRAKIFSMVVMPMRGPFGRSGCRAPATRPTPPS